MGLRVAPENAVPKLDPFLHLPAELCLRVCCFLDPTSLDAVALVSRAARALTRDEYAWKAAFLETFRTADHFTGLGRTWRREYSSRSSLLRQYQRGRGRIIVFDGKIGNVTSLYHDTANARVILANVNNGLASLADTVTGKVSKQILFPTLHAHPTRDVQVIAMTKNCVAYGIVNGTVVLNYLDKQGRHTDSKTMTTWHDGPVTALCLRDSKTTRDHQIEMVSGGADGTIKLWRPRDQRTAVLDIGISTAPIRKMVWDEVIHNRLYVLCSDRKLVYLNLDEVDDVAVHDIHLEISTDSPTTGNSWCDLVCDHSAGTLFLATPTGLTKFTVEDGSVHTLTMSCDLSGCITHLAIDPTDSRQDYDTPGSGGRHLVVASDSGELALYDTRDTTGRPRYTRIDTSGVAVTTVAVNATVIAVGHSDGSVSLFSAINFDSCRPLASRIAKYERIAEEDPVRTEVRCIDLLQGHPSGIITTGGQVRTFDFDPRSDAQHGKRKALSKKKHVGQPLLNGGKLAVQAEIRDDVRDVLRRKEVYESEQVKVKKLAGAIALDLTEEELVSYGELLSLESQATGSGGSPEVRKTYAEELEEAIKRSTLEAYPQTTSTTSSQHERESQTSATAHAAHSPYQEDYDLAIALSRSLV